jgi:hypothetical protein
MMKVIILTAQVISLRQIKVRENFLEKRKAKSVWKIVDLDILRKIGAVGKNVVLQ